MVTVILSANCIVGICHIHWRIPACQLHIELYQYVQSVQILMSLACGAFVWVATPVELLIETCRGSGTRCNYFCHPPMLCTGICRIYPGSLVHVWLSKARWHKMEYISNGMGFFAKSVLNYCKLWYAPFDIADWWRSTTNESLIRVSWLHLCRSIQDIVVSLSMNLSPFPWPCTECERNSCIEEALWWADDNETMTSWKTQKIMTTYVLVLCSLAPKMACEN